MVRRDKSETIIDRKETYIEHTTDLDWLNLNMLRWEFRLPKIDLSISFNLVFKFLLDFYLNVDLHIPYEEFDFEMPDFVRNWELIEKGVYGQTKYNLSYYDPPEIPPKSMSRFAWNMRYASTEKSSPYYKKTSEALKRYFLAHKEILERLGVKPQYVDRFIEALMMAEGKVLNSAYVGYAIVNISKVTKRAVVKKGRAGIGKIRWTDDFRTEHKIKTRYPYETLVNYARVNYARVLPEEKKYKETHLRPLAKELKKRIDDFKKRATLTPITKPIEAEVRPEIKQITEAIEPPKHTLYQRVFFLQKREKMKWEGGKHQARLQNIIEHVKPILDRYGIHGVMRLGYISFAKEYAYLHYKPHRKYKQWKDIITEEDLILKHKRMGLNETILRDIVNVIKSFKIVNDRETGGVI